jgi:hypothetical protein
VFDDTGIQGRQTACHTEAVDTTSALGWRRAWRQGGEPTLPVETNAAVVLAADAGEPGLGPLAEPFR